MNPIERVDLEPAFVLHTRSYRETSLLVEAFSRSRGRVALIARGARRPKSNMRGLLQPFTALALSWRGRGELVTLTGVETQENVIYLAGSTMLVGFYLNELMLRFVHRHDPEPKLFDDYRTVLREIVREDNPERGLRIFEKRLLDTVGYALQLEHEAGSGAAVEADGQYRYTVEVGPKRQTNDTFSGVSVSGATLLALAREQLTDPQMLKEAKRLMRAVIDAHCGQRPFASRKLWKR